MNLFLSFFLKSSSIKCFVALLSFILLLTTSTYSWSQSPLIGVSSVDQDYMEFYPTEHVFYGTANASAIADSLPNGLYPVLVRQRAVVAIAFINYHASSIGPYKEMAIMFMADTHPSNKNYLNIEQVLMDHAFSPSTSRGYYTHRLILGHYPGYSDSMDIAVDLGLSMGFPKSAGQMSLNNSESINPLEMMWTLGLVGHSKHYQFSAADNEFGIQAQVTTRLNHNLLQGLASLYRINPAIDHIQSNLKTVNSVVYTSVLGQLQKFNITKVQLNEQLPQMTWLTNGEGVRATTSEAQQFFNQFNVSFQNGVVTHGSNKSLLRVDPQSIDSSQLNPSVVKTIQREILTKMLLFDEKHNNTFFRSRKGIPEAIDKLSVNSCEHVL